MASIVTRVCVARPAMVSRYCRSCGSHVVRKPIESHCERPTAPTRKTTMTVKRLMAGLYELWDMIYFRRVIRYEPFPPRAKAVAYSLAILALTCAAYAPVLKAGFVWDDFAHVLKGRDQ